MQVIPPAAALPQPTPAQTRAARDFEALALSQMLSPAFATVDMTRSAFGGGAAEAQWRPMLLDAMVGGAVRGGGGIGLADLVLRAMLQRQAQADAPPGFPEDPSP